MDENKGDKAQDVENRLDPTTECAGPRGLQFLQSLSQDPHIIETVRKHGVWWKPRPIDILMFAEGEL